MPFTRTLRPAAAICLAAAALPAQVTVTADPASTVPGGEVNPGPRTARKPRAAFPHSEVVASLRDL